ncbi:hypothetical protein [Pseudomonas sp. R1-7]|uniref:hypothetical protein n=1 Tax=Pseudomonas sp. R1-7 TaxID=2817398 RepID=UPI003DA867FC
MIANQPLNDELVSRLEEKIPILAKGAIHAAYINMLAAGLSVMEVRDGVLVETTADGQHTVIRVAKPKHKVASGRIIKVRRFSYRAARAPISSRCRRATRGKSDIRNVSLCAVRERWPPSSLSKGVR